MKRVLLAAVICAVFFACSHRSASAMIEFCPASLNIQPVGSLDGWRFGDSVASMYGFELTALGARTAGGTIAFDTDSGWYTAEVPPVGLFAKIRHFRSPVTNSVRRDFVSARMYVGFPGAVRVMNAWMYRANAQNDGGFGWQAQGEVQCSPLPRPDPKANTRSTNLDLAEMDQNDSDRLGTAPSPRSLTVEATPAKPLLQANCKNPFSDAIARVAVTPDWPLGLGRPLEQTQTAVQVAINPDGSLADAWIWVPSGFRAFDDAALQAARESKYNGARAYCNPVPSRYLFKVTFDPS